MAQHRRILAQVLIEISPLASRSADATKAALRSAIQVGLNAQVLELNVYPIATEDGTSQVESEVSIPHSAPSDRDRVIEEYAHSGMQVQIYRNAGRRTPPSYFAVVLNPNVKSPTGAVMHADSYAELKRVAEARAERKAFLLQRKRDAGGSANSG